MNCPVCKADFVRGDFLAHMKRHFVEGTSLEDLRQAVVWINHEYRLAGNSLLHLLRCPRCHELVQRANGSHAKGAKCVPPSSAPANLDYLPEEDQPDQGPDYLSEAEDEEDQPEWIDDDTEPAPQLAQGEQPHIFDVEGPAPAAEEPAVVADWVQNLLKSEVLQAMELPSVFNPLTWTLCPQ